MKRFLPNLHSFLYVFSTFTPSKTSVSEVGADVMATPTPAISQTLTTHINSCAVVNTTLAATTASAAVPALNKRLGVSRKPTSCSSVNVSHKLLSKLKIG